MRRIIPVCLQCGDTGVLTAVEPEFRSLEAFSCSCEVAKRKGRRYPVWDREKYPDHELVKEGFIPRKKEEGPVA